MGIIMENTTKQMKKRDEIILLGYQVVSFHKVYVYLHFKGIITANSQSLLGFSNQMNEKAEYFSHSFPGEVNNYPPNISITSIQILNMNVSIFFNYSSQIFQMTQTFPPIGFVRVCQCEAIYLFFCFFLQFHSLTNRSVPQTFV